MNLDPRFRLAVISLGAFLENFELAAQHAGFASDVTYFPSGWPEPQIDIQSPVASIDLVPDVDVVRDNLFVSITARRSHRRAYKRKKIAPELFGTLASSFDSGPAPIAFGYISHGDLKNEIAGCLVDAIKLELADRARYAEMVSWVRSSSKERGCCRTGLNWNQLGMSPFSGWYGRLLMKILSGPGKEQFLKSSFIKLARKQAFSAAAFGWIASKENHRITQVRVGRVYERVHLTASSIGLSVHPMTQITRDYGDMNGLRERFYGLIGIPETHTIQMFFRLGYSEPEPVVPRLPVEDFIQ